MLHTVVAQDQVEGFAGQQCLHGTGAIGVDHQWHAGALHDQQRLVARLIGRLIGLHPPRQLWRLGTITAADHTHLQPLLATAFDQPEDHRRLAGATDGDVAHHNDRYRCPVAGTVTP
ncbi:hypothetical protein D3C79_931990 [compost metagenome]